MNDMYNIFVIFHSRWSGKVVLCSLPIGKTLLFVMRMLSCVVIGIVSSICLISSKLCWCTLDKSITEFCFSGRISRVHFVVNMLFSTVAVIACSMLRLQFFFFSLLSLISWSVLLLVLSFLVFINVTRWEIDSCFLFCVVDRAVTFLDNAIFSLVLLELLVVVAFGFELRSRHGDFGWLLEEGDVQKDS